MVFWAKESVDNQYMLPKIIEQIKYCIAKLICLQRHTKDKAVTEHKRATNLANVALTGFQKVFFVANLSGSMKCILT